MYIIIIHVYFCVCVCHNHIVVKLKHNGNKESSVTARVCSTKWKGAEKKIIFKTNSGLLSHLYDLKHSYLYP